MGIRAGTALIVAALLGAPLQALPAAEAPAPAARHVLLLSIDGMHQQDLEWYARRHPGSTLARLRREGRVYRNASAPFPADSFPGLLAQLTGALPPESGVYYDDSYSRQLLPAGTTDCGGARAGAEVALVETLDRDPTRLDAGQGIAGLYADLGRIRGLTGSPRDLLDPSRLPVDPRDCRPRLPHRYLRTNTVFDVAHAHGLRTAWADKHPAYEILQGAAGNGLDDLFTPEIDGSVTDPALPAGPGPSFTDDNLATQAYDRLKVAAVLHWVEGQDHAGVDGFGTPAIFGMNFQSVSTAQKLNHSDYFVDPDDPSTLVHAGLGGYVDHGHVPGPVLKGALRFVDGQLQRIVSALDPRSTVLLISAKHGQAPRDRSRLLLIDNRQMLDALESAWKLAHPQATVPLVAHSVNDDGVVLWLNDRSDVALRFTEQFLLHYSGVGLASDLQGRATPRPFRHGGLDAVHAGASAARFLGASVDDERVPDIVGVAHFGSVWAGHKLGKIAEHGGDSPEDRHVPLLLWGAAIRAGHSDEAVQTRQIAPTLLELLGLPARELDAMHSGMLRALPGVSDTE